MASRPKLASRYSKSLVEVTPSPVRSSGQDVVWAAVALSPASVATLTSAARRIANCLATGPLLDARTEFGIKHYEEPRRRNARRGEVKSELLQGVPLGVKTNLRLYVCGTRGMRAMCLWPSRVITQASKNGFRACRQGQLQRELQYGQYLGT